MTARRAMCVAAILGLIGLPASARAWTYGEFLFGVGAAWQNPASGSYMNIPVYEMGFLPSWPENTMPSFTANPSGLRAGAAWAYWMWARDGSHSVQLYQAGTYSGSYGLYSDGSWYDADDDRNVYWWDLSTRVGTTAPNQIGREATELSILYYSESDVWIRSDWSYPAVATNTQAQCLAFQVTPDLAHLHEIGHSYGFGHNDAIQTTMNTILNGHSSCNVASGYHPTSDEMYGLRTLYPFPGTFRNISGMPFYSTMSGPAIDAPMTFTGTCTQSTTRTATFTRMNHYTAGTIVKYRGVIVRSSVLYPTPADVVSTGAISPSFSMSAGSSAQSSYTITVPFNSLPLLNTDYPCVPRSVRHRPPPQIL
ncbi:MAG: hypothetical protein IT379_07665 [Deltaproteobacteria bacterium]|nr:hypothetical protein [Deltaproteobacteria bacterium]